MALSQDEIEKLSEEEYAFYLAFGTPDPLDLTWEEYEKWLRSIQEFDL